MIREIELHWDKLPRGMKNYLCREMCDPDDTTGSPTEDVVSLEVFLEKLPLTWPHGYEEIRLRWEFIKWQEHEHGRPVQ